MLRTIAIVIAIVAAIDPAITSTRDGRPNVAVVAANPAHDSTAARRVAQTLGRHFDLLDARLSAASATVIVGSALPPDASTLVTPVFAVVPDSNDQPATIASVDAPPVASVDASVPVRVVASGSRERLAQVDGLLTVGGTVVAGEDSLRGAARDRDPSRQLAFTPAGPGLSVVRALLVPRDGSDTSAADVAVDVTDAKHEIFWYDARPSWMSTFVRRSVEGDGQFAVTSRTVTSRNLSTDAGAPPSLDRAGALDQYEVVVIGGPDALTEPQVALLDQYLRRRGGTVVILLDQAPSGAWQRLVVTPRWRSNESGKALSVNDVSQPSAMLATDFAWPDPLPQGAVAVASSTLGGSTSAQMPTVWEIPVGAGRVVISGALDAWRHRDVNESGFNPFWRATLADLSASAPPAVGVTLSQTVVRPEEWIDISVTLRDAALHDLPAHATVEAHVDGNGELIRLWPGDGPGMLQARVRAPGDAGGHHVVVTADHLRGSAAFAVRGDAQHATPDQRDLLAVWTATRRGAVFSNSDLGRLDNALRTAIAATPRRVRWHPMHSWWWLLPFALALSGEWWLRRRRGLP